MHSHSKGCLGRQLQRENLLNGKRIRRWPWSYSLCVEKKKCLRWSLYGVMGSRKRLVWLAWDLKGNRLKAWNSIFKARNSGAEEWDKHMEFLVKYLSCFMLASFYQRPLHCWQNTQSSHGSFVIEITHGRNHRLWVLWDFYVPESKKRGHHLIRSYWVWKIRERLFPDIQ
jgi:hypothetical protein